MTNFEVFLKTVIRLNIIHSFKQSLWDEEVSVTNNFTNTAVSFVCLKASSIFKAFNYILFVYFAVQLSKDKLINNSVNNLYLS